MPEGDTIFRTASTLRRALAGAQLSGFRSTVPGIDARDLSEKRVTDVRARGKHLLIHFEGGLVLHTHMRMHGAWHLYRPGERWQRPASAARVVLETARFVAVCFSAPVVELHTEESLARHPPVAELGPDILAPDFDVAEAARHLRAHGDLAIGEALLFQSAVAGIGNVYKSEVLFLCGLEPATRMAELDGAAVEAVLVACRTLMLRNLDGFPRVTRHRLSPGRHWVYRRGGRPCFTCGTAIRMVRQGLAGRSTYWCPACQPAREISHPSSEVYGETTIP